MRRGGSKAALPIFRPGNGQCSITKTNVNKNGSSVTFTVDSVTHTSNTYDAGANHDPDGDSNGTAIVVLQP